MAEYNSENDELSPSRKNEILYLVFKHIDIFPYNLSWLCFLCFE